MKKKIEFKPNSSCLETVQRIIRKYSVKGYEVHVKNIDHDKGTADLVYTHYQVHTDDNSKTN